MQRPLSWLRRRPILRFLLITGFALVVALVYAATRPWFEPAYGIEPISLGNGKKLYLKRLDSGAVGPERLWLSENPRRCAGFPDPTHDYLGNSYDDTIWYRVSNGKLAIYDYAPWKGPSGGSTMPVEFVPTYDEASHQFIPKFANLEGDQAKLGLSRATVRNLRDCSVFPDGLLDGSWRDWFN